MLCPHTPQAAASALADADAATALALTSTVTTTTTTNTTDVASAYTSHTAASGTTMQHGSPSGGDTTAAADTSADMLLGGASGSSSRGWVGGHTSTSPTTAEGVTGPGFAAAANSTAAAADAGSGSRRVADEMLDLSIGSSSTAGGGVSSFDRHRDVTTAAGGAPATATGGPLGGQWGGPEGQQPVATEAAEAGTTTQAGVGTDTSIGNISGELITPAAAFAAVPRASADVVLPVASGRGADVLVGAAMQPVSARGDQQSQYQFQQKQEVASVGRGTTASGGGVASTAGRAAGGLIGAIQGMIAAGRGAFEQVRVYRDGHL